MSKGLQIFNYQYVTNSAGTAADIFIDGDIVDEPTREILRDWWGDETSVSFKSLRNQIIQAGIKDILITINSGGGHVGDAMAMHDTIVDLNSKGWNINTKACGIVASAATYPFMAGKKCTITANSWLMIHNVAGGIYGDVNEIENYARMMRKFNDRITNFYAEKTGQTANKIAKWMNEETWMAGEEAKNNGFATDCTGSETFTNAIKPERWPFSNKTVLNSYNKEVNQILNMDLKQFKEELLNGIKDIFSNKNAKPEDQAQAIANAVGTQVEALMNAEKTDRETAISNAVTTAVANATTGEAFTTAVANAVSKHLETVPANIQTAINTATEGMAKAEDMNRLVNDVAEKLGKPQPAGNGGGTPGKLDASNHPGVGWGE